MKAVQRVARFVAWSVVASVPFVAVGAVNAFFGDFA